jgi:hypothetical protein
VLAAELDRLDVGPDERGYGSLRFSDSLPEPVRQGPRKLVYGVAFIVVLAVIGLTIAAKSLTGPDKPAQNEISTHASTAASQAPVAEPSVLALNPSQLHLYDPQGDGTATTGLARALDGKASTGWKTEHYQQNFGKGGLKNGIGLWIDLGSAQTVADVMFVMSNNGASAKLLAGNEQPGPNSYKTFTQIGSSLEEFNGTNMVFSNSDDQPQKFRYLLLWITNIPVDTNDASQRYQIGVQEITVRVA